VLVTVDPARIPKLAAVPRLTGNWAFMQTENVAYRINAADFLMAFSFLSPKLPLFGSDSSEILHLFASPNNKI
jgi:hypothetical protein